MPSANSPSATSEYPTVAIVGGGQLARMTYQAAISLGLTLRVLAIRPDESAALVGADTRFAAPNDIAALREFAADAHVVTFDHEHVPPAHIEALAEGGSKVYPSSGALQYAQNKLRMRERLTELGLPTPRWARAESLDDVVEFGDRHGWPLVVKTPSGGYDGKGVWVLDDAVAVKTELPAVLASSGVLLVEERVAMVRELSAVVARSPYGQAASWPVVHTVQRGGVCVEVIAPAPDLTDERAERIQRLAIEVAATLDVVGVLAVELFDTGDEVLVNELAMRPHNSGHWTIEGSRTSQFEQHLRAVMDYPLGATTMTSPGVVMANVLAGVDVSGDDPRPAPLPEGTPGIDERLHHLFAHDPGARVHLYGKHPSPGRKVGHVTVLADGRDDIEALRERARRAAAWLGAGVPLKRP